MVPFYRWANRNLERRAKQHSPLPEGQSRDLNWDIMTPGPSPSTGSPYLKAVFLSSSTSCDPLVSEVKEFWAWTPNEAIRFLVSSQVWVQAH